MAGIRRPYVLFVRNVNLANTKFFSTTSQVLIKWRYIKNVEPNPNRYGKLTNLPDYSFVDGRPVPLGMNLYKRQLLQMKYCKRIVELSDELDFAIERYNKIQEEKKEERNKIIGSRLKEKGEKFKPLIPLESE